jgi:hypothetical protein
MDSEYTADTPDDSGSQDHVYYEAMEVEPDRLAGPAIIGMTVIGFIALVLMIAGVVYWVTLAGQTRQVELAAQATAPALRQAQLDATQKLGQYEIQDPTNGVYRIPIDRAMELVVRDATPQQAIAVADSTGNNP